MRRACLHGVLYLAVGASLSAQTTTGGPVITSVLNSASGSATIESGSWVSIYGTGLATTTRPWQASDFSGNTLPTTLDNVSVLIDGKKAAIAYVSSTQLNVQAPTDSATGAVSVQVTNLNGTGMGTATLQAYSSPPMSGACRAPTISSSSTAPGRPASPATSGSIRSGWARLSTRWCAGSRQPASTSRAMANTARRWGRGSITAPGGAIPSSASAGSGSAARSTSSCRSVPRRARCASPASPTGATARSSPAPMPIPMPASPPCRAVAAPCGCRSASAR